MFVFGTTVSEHLAAVPPPQEREEDIGVRRSAEDRKNELDHGRTRLQLPKVRPQGTLRRTTPPRTRLRERQQRGRPRKDKNKIQAARTTGSTRLRIASTRQMGRKHRRSSELDRIEDLVAEERAVLEQLEATRARLRQKLADSPDYQILRAITDASASSTSGTQLQEPTANVRLENVFPALTNGGERPLETGLQRGNHMLPIFQLPRVAKDAPLANPLPKEPTEEEKERLQAELDARAQARSHLGLSEDEVKYFDAVLKNGPSVPLPLPLPQPSSTSDVDARKAARKGAKRNQRSISTKALTNPREPQTSTVSSAVALRKELSTSIKSVQSLTNLVQDGVAALQREYPGAARTAKSKALVQRWGIAKLDQVFRKRDRARTRESLAQWQRFTQWVQLAEKQMVYQMMQGAGKLAHVLSRLQRARLASRMKRWIAIFDFERNNEEYVAMSRACVVIQRCWRGYRGRLWYAACKLQKDLHEQHMAAAKLQSIFRGRHAKKKVSTLREKQILHGAARRMQTAFRARLARKRVVERRARLEAENLAALKMQAAWRRKRGQMAYHLLRRARRDQAASRMQSIQRKRLAKRKVEAMRVHQRRERACLMVQRAYRSRLARKRIAERRVEYAKELEVKERCALRLQAVYRGHRGRLVYQLKSHARRAAQEHDAQQVSKIQSLFRGKMGRRKAAERRKEYLEEMCAWARAWVEEFDENTNDYVFRNLHTQEVYAEPPPDGYTKRDGMLALLDGRVLEDPVIVARREREKNLLQCIECDETAATRKCVECDDIYCDDCFDAIHLKGALASHAFEWFQDGGPQEGEPADLAAAGSASADGGLVGAGGAPDWIELFDEESGYPYWYDQTTGVTTWEMPPELAQQQDMSQYNAAAGAEGMEGGSEWATYFDEASGQNYMYNATTGECIWEHEQQEQPHQDEENVVYDENTGYPQEQDDGYGYY